MQHRKLSHGTKDAYQLCKVLLCTDQGGQCRWVGGLGCGVHSDTRILKECGFPLADQGFLLKPLFWGVGGHKPVSFAMRILCLPQTRGFSCAY